MTNTEKFCELYKDFETVYDKFSWWNGAEFGTLLGCFILIFAQPLYYWILFVAFWIEFAFACYYQRQAKKILEEMEKLNND